MRQLCYRESWNQPSVKIWPREMTWQMHSLHKRWQGVEHIAHFQHICQVGYLVNANSRMEKKSELYYSSEVIFTLFKSCSSLYLLDLIPKVLLLCCTCIVNFSLGFKANFKKYIHNKIWFIHRRQTVSCEWMGSLFISSSSVQTLKKGTRLKQTYLMAAVCAITLFPQI